MKTNQTKINKGAWVFDAEVAKNFDSITEKHIPHYKIVLEKCLQITRKAFPGDNTVKIIDVGSATGQTLDIFFKAGFKNIFGVENSESMRQLSKHKNKVILSDSFPKSEKYFDVIIANWTLHFVNKRKQYLKDIYTSLAKDGYFILTDKMSTSSFVHDRYHDFKRGQGVSEEGILKKEMDIKGILVTKPLSWYLKTLSEVGFSQVEVIDSDWCFVSILCKK